MNKKEWQELGLPHIEIEDLRSEISLFAQLGLVMALNITDGNFEASFPAILLVSPEAITEEQARVLQDKKELLRLFNQGITFIRIIDKDRNVVDRPKGIYEYYEKYVDPLIVEKFRRG